MTPTKLPALRKRYRKTLVFDTLTCGWICQECGARSSNYAPVEHKSTCSVPALEQEINYEARVEAMRRARKARRE